MGNFVECLSGDLVRIDQILVHNYEDCHRLFIKATRVDIGSAYDDQVLGASYRRLNITPLSAAATSSEPAEVLLVGLPSIKAN